MDSDSFVVVVVVNAVICSFLGALIGGRRDAAGVGAILGFLFGEVGLIVAFALDDRPKCSQCGERVNRDARLCSHCRSPIYWLGNQQFETQEKVQTKRANQLVAEREMFAKWDEADRISKARSAALRAWLWRVVKSILKAAVVTFVTACAWLWGMTKTGSKASVTAILWPFRKLHGVLNFLSGGDSYVYGTVAGILACVLIVAATLTFDIHWDFAHVYDAPTVVAEVQQPAVAPVGQLNPPITADPVPFPDPFQSKKTLTPTTRNVTVDPVPIPDQFPDSIPQPQALVVSLSVGPLESQSNTLIGKQPGDSQEVTLPGGVKLKLVWCPPGTITMGTPGATDDEAPVQVTLKGYWIAETETTQGQWTRVMGLYSKPWSGQTLVKEGPNFPASYMSHEDAEGYCVNLTENERRDGRLPTGWKYALPTEAQWEYACRAGTTTQYSFGDDESSLGNYAWFTKNSYDIGDQHAVGMKKANPWGLRDMHGNVWEWCRDGYAGKLVGGPNPAGPSTGSDRVFRGGCWISSAGHCRSAFRSKCAPSSQRSDLGFRVVRTQDSQPIPSPIGNALVDVEVSPVVDEVEVEAAKSQAESKSRVPAGEFDTTVHKLAVGFKGHDPIALHKALRGRLMGQKPQSDAETEDQYNTRLRHALEKPFMGKLGVDSTFVFPTFQLFSPYNEEKRRFEFSVYPELQSEGIGFESPFSKFESEMKDMARNQNRGRPLGIPQPQIVIAFSNAFDDFLQVQVPMNPSTARAVSQHLRVLYIAKLEPPYLIEENLGGGFSLPPQITMSLTGVWVVRADSKVVLAKRKQGEVGDIFK